MKTYKCDICGGDLEEVSEAENSGFDGDNGEHYIPLGNIKTIKYGDVELKLTTSVEVTENKEIIDHCQTCIMKALISSLQTGIDPTQPIV